MIKFKKAEKITNQNSSTNQITFFGFSKEKITEMISQRNEKNRDACVNSFGLTSKFLEKNTFSIIENAQHRFDKMRCSDSDKAIIQLGIQALIQLVADSAEYLECAYEYLPESYYPSDIENLENDEKYDAAEMELGHLCTDLWNMIDNPNPMVDYSNVIKNIEEIAEQYIHIMDLYNSDYEHFQNNVNNWENTKTRFEKLINS